ncbi:MAG: leucine-rich repeat protein, partial [Kiritimatiellae bacterium]|nr:leucine-rich repeat protein [Kiritimatiellia bacterium]
MVEDNRGTAKMQSGDSAHPKTDSQWLDNTKTLKSLAFCILVALAAATVRAETRYGLFVGVNEFEYTSNLSACDWDAARMYDAYTTGGTCASANASLFVNRKAKKEDVRAKFSELAGKAKSGDTVLYYQSSHGGNNPDADGNDTKDAYLCLTDDTYGDAEFAEDLQLFKDGVNVIVVLDACFSGGMFKAAGVTSAADLRKNGWNFATRVRKLMGKRKTSTKDGGNGPSVAFVTAANWDETSSEIGRQGEFTGAFLDGWESAAADADADGKVTFAELAEYAKPVVENSSVQTSNDTLLKSIVAGQAFNVISYRLLYADGVLAGFFGTCPLSVAVADGTTEICWSAFDADYNDGVSNLTSVTIPASVTKIGQYAFYGCENLETVEFEGDFAAIDCPRYAFEETPVRDTLFPPPVNDAFADAIVLSGAIGMTNGWNYLATNTDAIDELANLGKATVWWAWTAPETDAYEFNTFGSRFDTMISVLKHIEGDDYGYDVVAANDDANNSGYNESAVYFSAIAGVTYYIGVSGYDEYEGDITLNWKKSVFSLTIEDGTLVGFTGLCPATLDLSAEAITSIAERVFAECTSLRELTLPESLASIGNGAFYGCENLETVVCANANWQEDAEVDVDSAFGGTPWLLGPLEMTVDEDGTLQVSGFVKGDIVIPDGTKIIPGSAFSGCHRLASVVIPSSVTHIGEEAFYECHALMNIEFVAKEPAIEPADEEGAADYAYFDDTLEIGDRAFCNTAIRSLEIPAHVSVVGNSAFESSHALTNVVFKSDDRLVDSYLDVGDYAFGECHYLVRVVFEPRVYDEGKEIWNQVNISGAFRNCSNLVELDLCAGISGFSADSIDGCPSLAVVSIAEGGQEYVSIDGMVYNRWADVDEEEDENGNIHVVTNAVKKYLVRCPEGKTGVVRLGLDICDINGDAFRNCKKLDKVQ